MNGGIGPARRQRNLGLDVARAAAILMVLTSHVMTASGQLSGVLANAAETVGQVGVELFFSLSGFLIGGILIRLAEDGAGWSDVLRFMVRRWFRTLPLYYLMLIIMGLWLQMDVRHSLLLVQNFYPAEPRALPVSWSLVMEEYFYLCFPLIMVGLRACGLRRASWVVGTATLLVVACSTLRLWNAYGYGYGWPAPLVHESPVLRLDCAAYGALAAWVNHRFADRIGALLAVWGGVLTALILGLAVVNAALLVWVLGADTTALVAAGFLRWGATFLAMQPAALDASFAGLVLALAHARLDPMTRVAEAVGWISMVSYSLYLVHLPVIGEVTTRLPHLGPTLTASLSWGGSLLLAAATYHWVERPMLTVRDRLVADR